MAESGLGTQGSDKGLSVADALVASILTLPVSTLFVMRLGRLYFPTCRLYIWPCDFSWLIEKGTSDR